MNTEMESKSLVLYDRDIREPLFDYLEERFGKTRMFEEKIIGRSRADIIMLTERQLIGLEIKSDADTYERLKRQIRDYNKYCDVNYVGRPALSNPSCNGRGANRSRALTISLIFIISRKFGCKDIKK